MESLLSIKKDEPCVRKCESDPLVVCYWFDNQITLSHEVKNLKIPTSIHAAGRFVVTVEIIPGQHSSPIFLYNVTVNILEKIFSLTQMLSSKHDVITIYLWLRSWINSGAAIPVEIVADCSKALLNALCKAFNNRYYATYLDDCLILLEKSDVAPNQNKPPCLMKRDKNHTIKAPTRWDEFHNNPVIKAFYLRIVGYGFEIRKLL